MKTTKEYISFRYESVENLVRLLVTIQYEKTHNSREIELFHKRFDKEPDDIFGEFLVKLYPQGANIGEKEINALVNHIDYFMDTDEEAKDLEIQQQLKYLSSYVYFKIDKKIYTCSFASHQQTIRDICVDYFKGFDMHDLSVEKVKRFILNNFLVRSSFSTVETIADDAYFIYNCIMFDNE